MKALILRTKQKIIQDLTDIVPRCTIQLKGMLNEVEGRRLKISPWDFKAFSPDPTLGHMQFDEENLHLREFHGLTTNFSFLPCVEKYQLL